MRLPESDRRRLTLLAMCVSLFIIQVDVTIVNVALPSIQHSLHTSPGGLEWVISAYALALAALIPVGGALGDRFGRKRIFLIGVTVFAIGSIACALSRSDAALIGSRALQGAGGAAMLALTLSIITETFPPQARTAAIGTWAAIGGTGFGVGPVIGGILLSFFGWSSVFWVNVPFAVVAVSLTLAAVAESRDPASRRLDGPGVASSALGLVGITLGLIEASSHPWGSSPVLAPLAIGAVLLLGFALWERHCRHPMIPPALLGARSFVSASAVFLVAYAAFGSVLYYVTLLFQDVNGWSPLRTGLSWLFMNAPFLFMAQLTGRIDRRYPPSRVVAAGCVVGALGILALSRAGTSTPFILTAFGYVLAGAGFGVLVPGVTHVAMRDVPAGVSGAASGVVNASRQVGTSVGLAVLGSLGVTAATSHWDAAIQRLPASVRAGAARQGQNVAGGHISAVVQALGPAYKDTAALSFVHGYQLAVGIGAAFVLAAGVIAVLGLGKRHEGTFGKSKSFIRNGPGRLPSRTPLRARVVGAGNVEDAQDVAFGEAGDESEDQERAAVRHRDAGNDLPAQRDVHDAGHERSG
jgi:MFS transporter, DHA2 family, methylenomycin A resistance protein